MRKVNSQTLLSWFSVIASYNPCLRSLFGGVCPNFETEAVPRSTQSWVLPRVFVPDAGGLCSLVTKAEIFSAEHSLGLSCAQVFIFWFSNLILLFFWSVYQVPLRFIFRPFYALIFLMLISVFVSMSIFLSSFQYLHKTYPILLVPGFWCLASAYFMNFIFLLVQFLVYSLS